MLILQTVKIEMICRVSITIDNSINIPFKRPHPEIIGKFLLFYNTESVVQWLEWVVPDIVGSNPVTRDAFYVMRPIMRTQ